MRVLHCFDKYLNSTMNWACHAIRHTPGVQPLIAAPLIVRNQYFDAAFEYLHSGWQWQLPADEWSFSALQRVVARLLRDRYWTSVFNRLKHHPPSIVHAHFASVGCVVMEQASQQKLPLIISFYGADYERLPHIRPEFKKRYRRLFELATLLVCEGEHGASILAKMGCPELKIRVVRLGISPDNIPFQQRKKQSGQLRLLQAATMVEKKGFMSTLEAFRLALQTCPDMHLTLAGEQVDKKLVHAMRHYLSTHALEKNVTWLDFIDNRQFHAFLGNFDVFIHPSCYAADRDCEGGAPVVLLDAQATGLPVIATTHCDIPAEVVHEHTGLLSPERDIRSLAASIGRFYQMEDAEYQQYSQHARRHIEQGFNVRATGERLSRLYREVLHLPQKAKY